MDQGTSAWLEWRNKGLGSSDAPVIMNVSPFKTRFCLWKEKVNNNCDDKKSYIFEKGHRLEKQARAQYEIMYGHEMKPIICQHIDHDWLRCSLDGYNKETNVAIECKYVSDEIFEKGECPEYYYPQIQHIYLVTNALSVDLVLIKDMKKGNIKIKVVNVPIDYHYIYTKLVPHLIEFKHLIDNKIRPIKEFSDYPKFEDKKVVSMIKSYIKNREKVKTLSRKIDVIIKEMHIEELCINAKMEDSKQRYRNVLIERSGAGIKLCT